MSHVRQASPKFAMYGGKLGLLILLPLPELNAMRHALPHQGCMVPGINPGVSWYLKQSLDLQIVRIIS